MNPYLFTLDFKVRDYECDLQGIVNNAEYQHYLEHTRHEYLLAIGIDFAEYARREIHLVVVRAELDYRSPLRSGETFRVGINLERVSRLRFAFMQDILRTPGDEPVLNARIIATALDANGRPGIPNEVETALEGGTLP